MVFRKQQQYSWKDSNLAQFGSDTERLVKKDAAKFEPAWSTAGQTCGLQIWRIVNWKVTTWPREDYGKFYDGDSYIILNTYKKRRSMELLYDVHFWIGMYSTPDEYGTAAYKTVELDMYLDDIPIQHREVQGHESELFKSYFESITILKGGADSGFRHVQPDEYTPRLLHFHGDRKGVVVKEVPRCKTLLDNTDVYILDLGLKLIQWNGSGSNKEERIKGLRYLKNLQDERGGKCRTETLDENPRDTRNEFYAALTEDGDADDNTVTVDKTKELYRLSDASGSMEMTLEKSGKIDMEDFDSEDVFIFDTKESVFVWIGEQTTRQEKRNAMSYAHDYLMKTDHPFVPICCLSENKCSEAFNMAIAA
ncbi:gelsolin-like protein 2 isoform X1 [Ruditapes philippinarum]|uniref:gelsolin-like protein 2 isoform X1 n=1 Tax=Ruditapes philippinarum TaxID=129788 RepID=UPI00295C14B8|nr:gelsolin-like protein 2 isoform X1 [Ruditapes philippinarum]